MRACVRCQKPIRDTMAIVRDCGPHHFPKCYEEHYRQENDDRLAACHAGASRTGS